MLCFAHLRYLDLVHSILLTKLSEKHDVQALYPIHDLVNKIDWKRSKNQRCAKYSFLLFIFNLYTSCSTVVVIWNWNLVL